ncbi:efflux RND transporter permease subunit [Candidatus Entotheonella palauensis]|uniref:efflux RND transporter permease subunit n=1 Tax=Candidatus Entotheonella palauensis TaxID=93172 RepID=UPI000B7C6B03|nr:multidrug efflux RND transporter permease subunit [Candidatus Entotheonella palauensis]
MFSRFFIYRPIFATVLSIVIIIAGAVSLGGLPIAQFPEITPPTVQVQAIYPGASAQIIAETVGAPIEQQVNGVEGMLYMASTSSSDGQYKLTITFEVGTDLDQAAVLVQNRVNIATPSLPEEVTRQGVTTKKQSPNILLLVSLYAEEEQYDSLYLSNYATLRLKDELSRIQGVGDITIFGSSDYSMRIWLEPRQLKSRNLTTQDVLDAIREQNVQVAAGQIGQPPAPSGQTFQYTVTTLGRLSDVEQFEQIIVKTAEDGRVTRLKDVARVELGAQSYDMFSLLDGKPSASLAIFQLPGANALDVAEQIRQTMDGLKQAFPQGMAYTIPFDTTKFVEAGINEVYETLLIAAVLVFCIIFLFLQDWRATVIPAVAIPVSLIGTFAAMGLLGFSINMLTLFGLVLAIGIVVDDAIVIVENIVRLMDDRQLSPRDAALRTMTEVSGPVVATSLVLMAVFIPAAFLPGLTGQLYRQFALTIAATTVFSTLNALTLSPALGALILRPSTTRRNPLFRGFNALIERSTRVYSRVVSGMLRRSAIMLLLYAAIVTVAGRGMMALPSGFLPQEDQGILFTNIQLPDAASQERTSAVIEQVNAILANTPGVEHATAIGGFSLLSGTSASNAATFFISLTPWDERQSPALHANAIVGHLFAQYQQIQEAIILPFAPPPISGLGSASGFDLRLQDRGGVGLATLQQLTQELTRDGNAQSGLTGLYSSFRANVPQLFADVDRTKAKILNIPLSTVFGTLQAYLGSAYVNDFNKFGRTYQVRIQADPAFRAEPDDIRRLDVRTLQGEMVPLGSLVMVEESFGPQIVTRYNLYPSASITGQAAPGYSSGQALVLMEQMADRKLPAAMGYEWTGVAYQEKQVGSEAVLIFALAIVLVYLVLAAQYESWTSPAAIILAVPLALLGTVVALMMRSMDNNTYVQIGIVLLIALASKNAILIVEFARENRAAGQGILDAALEAARLRFRPILMTACSTLLGMVPLVIASGAGAAGRRALGTAVFGGLVAATVLVVFFAPILYAVMQRLSEWRGPVQESAPASELGVRE